MGTISNPVFLFDSFPLKKTWWALFFSGKGPIPVHIMSSSYQRLLSLSKRLNTATTSAAGIAALMEIWQKKLQKWGPTHRIFCKDLGAMNNLQGHLFSSKEAMSLSCREVPPIQILGPISSKTGARACLITDVRTGWTMKKATKCISQTLPLFRVPKTIS